MGKIKRKRVPRARPDCPEYGAGTCQITREEMCKWCLERPAGFIRKMKSLYARHLRRKSKRR